MSLWRENGTAIEFDHHDAGAIRTALKQQSEVMRVFKDAGKKPAQKSAIDLMAKSVSMAVGDITPSGDFVPTTERTTTKLSAARTGVFKEGNYWGATVIVDGQPIRYQYKFRDQARVAKAEHEIGEAGRVA